MAFGGIEVVKGVDFDIRPGEVHAVVGENGAGKSTIGKIIAGVHRPTSGEILLKGKPVTFENPRQAIESGVALIHQEPLSFPDLDVTESIFAGHQLVKGPFRQVDWREMRRQAQSILDSLGVKLDPHAKVGQLSVADQQMVELAAALSRDADVLLLDETTAALTPKETAELFAIVRRLKAQGKAMAFVSHHLDEVFEIADRITVMRDGEKVAELKPSRTSVDEIVRLMVGRDVVRRERWTANVSSAAPILKVTGLGDGQRFEGVSFEIRPGEIVGLGGLVGAGRTDVCQAIFGVKRLTSGTIEVNGVPVKINNPRDAMSHGIALVPEDRQHDGLLMPMTIGENGGLATLPRRAKLGWRDDKAETSLVEDFLGRLHTAFRSVSQPVRELSGGNQQKVVLAKWLMTEPRLLILDEPTRGVDVGAKDEVHKLIAELVEKGLALLVVSSDLPELLDLCDRILVMKQGRIVGEFDRSTANSESIMFAATGQVAHAA